MALYRTCSPPEQVSPHPRLRRPAQFRHQTSRRSSHRQRRCRRRFRPRPRLPTSTRLLTPSYPQNSLAGNSFFYLGEIDYRAGKFSNAAKDYDKVLEQFPDSNKVPAAHLHKGEALIALNQNDAGIRELRSLIQRFPTSPEATAARSRLNAMGVPIHPRVQ